MRTINTTFGTFGASVLLLGLKGDSNATEILIDCAESLEEYQGTMAAMSITGPDDTVYPGDISLDENGIVHWVVAARDCGIAGNGSARVDLVDDDGTVVASAEARTIIMKTNMQGVAPDQIANWTEAASVALQEARAALLDLIDLDTTATANEAARQLAETGRVSAETLRASAETARASAETARATAENTRASAESTRIAAENTRASAESTRIAAENARVSEFSTIEANAQAALSYIGPSEANSTASAAHAAGSYFIYNGKLYQATADIAIGDTITSGTNCVQVPGGSMGEVSSLKSTLNYLENSKGNAIYFDESLEVGGINIETGNNENASKRARLKNKVDVSQQKAILIINQNLNYQYRLMIYDDSTYVGCTEYINDRYFIHFVSNQSEKIRLQYHALNDSTITSGILSDINVTFWEILEVNHSVDINDLQFGNVYNFGESHSRLSGGAVYYHKVNGNRFMLFGTPSGSNNYIALSDSQPRDKTTLASMPVTAFSINLEPDSQYHLNAELINGDSMESAPDNAAIRIVDETNRTVIAELPLNLFSINAMNSIPFATDATNRYGLFVYAVSSTNYSGEYRIWIAKDTKSDILSSQNAMSITEIKNDIAKINESLFTNKLSLSISAIIGGINTDTGNNENATYRARTEGTKKYPINPPVLIKKNSTNFAYQILLYDNDGVYIPNSYTEYIEDNLYYLAPSQKAVQIRVQYQTRPYRKVTNDDLNAINNLLEFYEIPLVKEALENETSAFAAQRGLIDGTADTLSRYPAFVHVTDIHEDGVRFKRAVEFAERIGAVGIFGTGDFVNYLTEQSKVKYLIDAVSESSIPFYPCSGNHEQISNTQLEPYEWIFQPLQEQGGYTLANVENPTYWHKDLTDLQIRLIAVNQFEDSPTQWIYNITQEQIDWLCSTISATPEGYGIVVLRHTSEKPVRRSATVEKFCEKDSVNPYLMNTIITDIVDAYISGTTINKTYPLYGDAELSADTVTVNYDFSSKNINTEFICFCDGHFHRDLVHYEYQTNNAIVDLNCTCTALMTYSGDLARIEDSPTQDAFNVYVIDRDRKVIKVVRIGSHLNYNFSVDRNYIEITYNRNPDIV